MNRPLHLKESDNGIESGSPSSKSAFYLGFLNRMSPLHARRTAAVVAELQPCERCGSPTTGDVCALCRLVAAASEHESVPFEMVLDKLGRKALL